MLNHSPSAHHLATIVLQDAGCTIVDLTRAEREREEREGREGAMGGDVAMAIEQEHV